MPGNLNVYYRARKQGLTKIEGIASLYSAYQKECRGRSPLPAGYSGIVPDGFVASKGVQRAKPFADGVFGNCPGRLRRIKRSAEGEALCRGSGCPRKTPFPLLPPQAASLSGHRESPCEIIHD